MKIQLRHRHYGVHELIKEIEMNENIENVYLAEDNINEDFLLSLIPNGWLPVDPKYILIMVSDKNGGSTGQRGLTKFRNWSKYYDSYSLDISE